MIWHACITHLLNCVEKLSSYDPGIRIPQWHMRLGNMASLQETVSPWRCVNYCIFPNKNITNTKGFL